MIEKSLTAVILAGGRGTRLGALTKGIPKPLVEVQGHPLLGYSVGFAHALGASRIVIAGSYLAEKLQSARKQFAIETILVTDSVFDPGKRIFGVLAARDFVEGDLVVFDADYIFHQEIADALRGSTYTEVTIHAADRISPWMTQDVVARATGGSRLMDLVKTKGTKKNLAFNELYFNSLLYCPQQHLANFLRVVESTAAIEGMGGQHLEDAIQAYNKTNIVRVRNLGRPLWVEIDTPAELNAAQRFVAAYPGAIPHA